MSIASEITRIAGLRDTIRTKLIDFGIITDTSAKLSACSEAIEGIDEATLTVPSLSIASNPTIDSATGLVSVSGSVSGTISASEGYSKGLSKSISVPVSGSLQLATQAAQTITPGTSNKTIAANRWLTGAQTIKGDSNLVAANILSGKSIFGVSGSAGPALTVLTYAANSLPVVTRSTSIISNKNNVAKTWNIPCATLTLPTNYTPICIMSVGAEINLTPYTVTRYADGTFDAFLRSKRSSSTGYQFYRCRVQRSNNTWYWPITVATSYSGTYSKAVKVYGYYS